MRGSACVHAAQQSDTCDALQHSLSASTSANIKPNRSAAADPRDERFARTLVVDLQLCDERFAQAFPEESRFDADDHVLMLTPSS